MRVLFAHGPGDPHRLRPPPGLELPTARGGEPVAEVEPVFVLADGGYRFHGLEHRTPAELRAALAGELELRKQSGGPVGLALMADARAPARTIVELVEELASPEVTFHQVVELADDTVPPAPPTPASVQAALDEARPDLRAMALAKLLEQAIGGCAPITALYQQLALMADVGRDPTLLDGLPGAVEACRCEGVDVEVLVAAVWQMSGKTTPGKRQLPLALTSEAGAEEVRLPAAATAADVARLAGTRGASPFRLVLAD